MIFNLAVIQIKNRNAFSFFNMIQFKEYYTDEIIIKQICKIRISYARRRNKKILLDNLTSKKFQIKEQENAYDNEIISKLDEILPCRRLWLTKGQRTYKSSLDESTGQRNNLKINTDDKNREILFNTIKKYRIEQPELDFIKKLNEFVKDVQNSIEDESYKICEPDILPEIKEKRKGKLNYDKLNNEKTECRPISRFILKDRIILSISNKYLTELFDDYFEDCSFAFRAVKEIDGVIKPLKHHNAITEILKYKESKTEEVIYVAECDMKKFYDTVNHRVCLKLFEDLIVKAKKDNPDINLNNVISIFKAYLDCYSFRENILIKNTDTEYWKKQKDIKEESINGIFPWVEDEINESPYYQQNKSDRIGVPQGGALSGLIANILLDRADKEIKQIKDVFYVRYCDDMILMHTEKKECQKAIERYIKSINQLHLFNHNFQPKYFSKSKNFRFSKTNRNIRKKTTQNNHIFIRSHKQSLKPFWSAKSKGPYRWGSFDLKLKTFPWIGFVGYEIHHEGHVRVRKKSLKKEMDKQKRVINSIIYCTKNEKRVKNDSIIRSAEERLTGMSVGRIKLYDYDTCKNELCWVNGFHSLNFNKYSKSQLKALDRNKYKQMRMLKKHLNEDTEKAQNIKRNNNDEIVDYYKPFSYYYQAGEKK